MSRERNEHCCLKPTADEYPFEGLPNTRDLGGIQVRDGRRIRSGMLFRSGALDRATGADLDVLVNRFGVRTVIDLRETCSPQSRDDVLLAGSPVRCVAAGMDGLRPLIPRPFRRASWAFALELKKMNLWPRAYQKRMYATMLFDRSNQASLATAFQTLLGPREGAVLWHCSIGKDRTGLLAALLLHCLGADRATIMQDYLASEHYLTAFGNEDDRVLRAFSLPEFMRRNVHETHTPRAEYLSTALGALEREYGSVDAFLSQALGIGAEERRQLQALYLEPDKGTGRLSGCDPVRRFSILRKPDKRPVPLSGFEDASGGHAFVTQEKVICYQKAGRTGSPRRKIGEGHGREEA